MDGTSEPKSNRERLEDLLQEYESKKPDPSLYDTVNDFLDEDFGDRYYEEMGHLTDEINRVRQLIQEGEEIYQSSLPTEDKTRVLIASDFRNIDQEFTEYLSQHQDYLDTVNWGKFQELLASIFHNQGYRVLSGAGSANQGIDLKLLQKDSLGEVVTLVEAKRYNPKRPIELDAVLSLFGAVEQFQANRGLFITTSRYLPAARELADKSSRLILADSEDIVRWCKEISIRSKLDVSRNDIKSKMPVTALRPDNLGDAQLHVLRLLRTSPSRISASKISEILLYSKDEVESALQVLKDMMLVRQDRRDKVSWNHERATYFSVPSKRKQIDNILKFSEAKFSRPLRVFLCHSSDDKPKIHELYRRLIANNIDPWLDEIKLLPGQDWTLEIPKAVREADVVIVCLSSNSIKKEGYVQKEIKFALDVADEKPDGTIFLIPLKLDNCEMPPRLINREWVEYFKEDGYSKLLKALRWRAQGLGIDGPPEEP